MSFDHEEHRVKRVLDNDVPEQFENSENNSNEIENTNTANSGQPEDIKSYAENLENEFVYPPKDPENEFEKSLNDNIDEDLNSSISEQSEELSKNQEERSEEQAYMTPAQKNAKEKQAREIEEDSQGSMGLLDHLSELRRRLTRIVIIILLGFFGFYGISEMAYAYLALPLTQLLPEGSTLIYTSPQGAFFTYLKVSFMLSIIGTSPLTFYQLWAFIAPGLYEEEQSALIPLAFFSALFFIGGAAFCYFLVFPIAFKFFLGFTTATIIPMISVEEYLSFALKLVIAFGLVFEMPLFSYFLAKLRIIGPEGMKKYRKYAILVIFCVAAILTPPDVFSQVLMALPMIILYEASIYIAKVVRSGADKKFAAKQAATAQDQDNE